MDEGSGEGRKLPATSYAILGLLTFGQEVSGYDLGKVVAQSIGFFWTPAKSQVYAELRRLVSVGYATEREVEQSGRPDKRLYAITPEGLRAFREWLERAPVELEPIKSPFLLKIFFGHLMDPGSVIGHIREYRRQMEGLLDEFLEIERGIPTEGDVYPYTVLTLKYGISYAKAGIAWCDQTLERLERGGARR
jgi:DNA-binding PadR family transcriptional regulator